MEKIQSSTITNSEQYEIDSLRLMLAKLRQNNKQGKSEAPGNKEPEDFVGPSHTDTTDTKPTEESKKVTSSMQPKSGKSFSGTKPGCQIPGTAVVCS